EFWRRWHISLNTWFRDYVYIPLGGSKGGALVRVRNILIVFLLSGLWHGANWTFVTWGLINALLFIPLLLSGRNRRNLGPVAEGRALPSLKELFAMAGTFMITLLAWTFFRAESIGHAMDMIAEMGTASTLQWPDLVNFRLFAAIGLLVGMEWLQRDQQHGLAIERWSALARRSTYMVTFLLIFFMGRFAGEEFIYFQF
ncbi:MAG: MBOAT family protein, partial [Flavobacteriales bacterium]|nr:MBOAT family protein [Flavobacteriales bacterium]